MSGRLPAGAGFVQPVAQLHLPIAELNGDTPEGTPRPVRCKGRKRRYSSSLAAMAREMSMPPMAVVFMPWPPKAVAHHCPWPSVPISGMKWRA